MAPMAPFIRLSYSIFSISTLSLGLGCDGGFVAAVNPPSPASSFRDSLPPATRDGDKLALYDTQVNLSLALRSAAIKLTGDLPTGDEIKRVRSASDPLAEYTALIDSYLGRATFAVQMIDFFQDTLKTGPYTGSPAGVNMSAAATFAAQLVVQGDDFTKLLTATSGTCPTYNATTNTFTDAACVNAPVGILSDAGVQSQFYSNMGFRRVRWVQETFMCAPFPAEIGPIKTRYPNGTFASPWDFLSISGSQNFPGPGKIDVDFHETSSTICANCHVSLNHQSPLMANFDATGKLQTTIQVETPSTTTRKSKRIDWLPDSEGTAWRFGVPVSDLKAYGQAIVNDPGFAPCMATRIWNWALSRGDVVADKVALTENQARLLSTQLVQAKWNLRTLIRSTFLSPEFIRYPIF